MEKEKAVHFTLYQMKHTPETRGIIFEDLEGDVANLSLYDTVFSGTVAVDEETVIEKVLEMLFCAFNADPPQGFQGRGMSISDIVRVKEKGDYICQKLGFRKIEIREER